MIKEFKNNYKKNFPEYPPLVTSKGWLYGVWMMGNNYKGSGYYGSYPPTYLKRIMSLFPQEKSVLHLFSGSLSNSKDIIGDTFDINKKLKATYSGEANELSKVVKKKYKLILADPPYSQEDALHYGQPLINRNKVLKECHKVLKKNGILVWLDQVFPMYKKTEFNLIGTIGMIRSTNHRVRMIFIFKKI